MTVSSTEGISTGLLALADAANAAGSTGSTGPAGSTGQDRQDMFLQLMVTQLQYQDPMNPVDTTDMMSQNAQFEALTQMQNMAEATNQVLAAQLSFGAASMLGQSVSWTGGDGTTVSGTPTAVSFTSAGPILTIGDQQVPVTSITGVAAGGTATS